ncbi:MAG: dipeptidase [candidate division KSB1 bacterium]|nr:dipeptidase [candidate division KSB1 bacterium]MDZ7273569.1 dipeptidase [candidate division KSB1 bacterium]MDZ7286840.1 dipeptidase [candidate division KSB1 bacterium]MDZ7299803.1 dipeptidase [candidate division KSB1 bacterium]MDZ7308646.1 dipeptidase [candidate division KSB1 bacterium]
MLFLAGVVAAQPLRTGAGGASETAARLHAQALVIDAHLDVLYHLSRTGSRADLSQRRASGHFDFVRAREGGLDASFFAIFVSNRFNATPDGAFREAQRLLEMLQRLLAANACSAGLAGTPEEVRRLVQAGKHAVILSLENGTPIGRDLSRLQHFYQQGIRYLTLCHNQDNQICDSSYDNRRTHRGLSAFGKQVVAEMNRLGMMIDVSHVSDEAFWQVLQLSQSPVIASHSGLRKFRSFQRNLSDEMLLALKKNGGVVCLNFGAMFLSEDYRRRRQTLQDVVKHIDHAVRLIGADHVGLGSDFDGVDEMPAGLEDVSCYPRLTAALLQHGYTAEEIEKITGGNLLRVWQANLDRRQP